jgi:DNA-binding transcriptional LysR family regulator
MNIKKLRMFHEVYVTGSITKAAERVCVSQPAASKMLSGFEEEIGYKLFVRQDGRLSPTDEAYYLYEEVFNLLQGANRLETSIKDAKHNKSGRLKIASTLGPSYSFLPKLISQYMRENPGIKASLHLMDSTAIREGVATGQYQIGLVDKSGPSSRYNSLVVNLLCYCAVPCDHSAAKLDRLNPDNLGDTPWITLSPENATVKALKKVYANYETNFNAVIEVYSTLHALAFVNQGMGVTLIDSLNNVQYLETFQFHNIKVIPFEPVIHEPFEVLTPNIKPLPGLAKRFYNALITEIETLAT